MIRPKLPAPEVTCLCWPSDPDIVGETAEYAFVLTRRGGWTLWSGVNGKCF